MGVRGRMSEWDYLTDFLVVGSGGGLAGALTAATSGLDTLVVEKEDLIGGSTAMSGGVIWLPNNPLMVDDGVPDSLEQGLEYFESVVGPPTRASSLERRHAYIEQGTQMVQLLRQLGLDFLRCEGYSDYYAGVRGYTGGVARGPAIACDLLRRPPARPVAAEAPRFVHGRNRRIHTRVVTGPAGHSHARRGRVVAQIIGRTIAGA